MFSPLELCDVNNLWFAYQLSSTLFNVSLQKYSSNGEPTSQSITRPMPLWYHLSFHGFPLPFPLWRAFPYQFNYFLSVRLVCLPQFYKLNFYIKTSIVYCILQYFGTWVWEGTWVKSIHGFTNMQPVKYVMQLVWGRGQTNKQTNKFTNKNTQKTK